MNSWKPMLATLLMVAGSGLTVGCGDVELPTSPTRAVPSFYSTPPLPPITGDRTRTVPCVPRTGRIIVICP